MTTFKLLKYLEGKSIAPHLRSVISICKCTETNFESPLGSHQDNKRNRRVQLTQLYITEITDARIQTIVAETDCKRERFIPSIKLTRLKKTTRN